MITTTPTPEALAFDLEPWLGSPGPVATVVLPTPSATDEAAERLRIEWKNARDALDRAGAPASVLDAIEAELSQPGVHAEGPSVLVLADEGRVAVVPLGDEEPAAVARWQPLPDVASILIERQGAVPHVVVVADRVGADILAVDPTGRVSGEAVDGDTEHITRSKPGGWSQRRYQQRAENTWEQNASAVAAEVDHVRADVGARIVVVAGDPRAKQFLREHAPAALEEVLLEVEGAGRSDPDSFDEIAPDVGRLVATVVAEDTLGVLDHFQRVRSTDAPSADGPDEVLQALSQGRVATLVAHLDPADERTASFDRESGQVALDGATLRELGLEPTEGRLVDVAVWAALRTGAGIRLVPAHGRNSPTGGLGALLRG